MEEFKLMSLRNIAAAALLGFSLLFNSGCNTEQAPVKKVASIDETAIYEMDMFKTAQADLKKWIDEEGKKAQEKVKDKSDEEKAKASNQPERLAFDGLNTEHRPRGEQEKESLP